jgi:hypothetical protein
MKFNSKSYSLDINPLKAGTYFVGEYISADTFYYIGFDKAKDTTIESFENDLTDDLKADFLRMAKNLKIELIQEEDDINLKTVFEYPVDSGDTYSVSRSTFAYYDSLILFKDSFEYPFEFVGNDGAKVLFSSADEVASFVGAALSKHQEVYKSRFLIAVNSVNDVVITTTLQSAILLIMNINY